MASLFYLPGTIESDDEMEAGICSNANSSSRKSGDGGDSDTGHDARIPVDKTKIDALVGGRSWNINIK